MRRVSWGPLLALVVAVAGGSGCSGGDGDPGGAGGTGAGGLADPGDCVAVDLAASPDKIELMIDLADGFNRSDAAEAGGDEDDCVFVRVQNKSSGLAESLLANGWDEEVEGPRPVIWAPAASTWGGVLNQHVGSEMVDQGAERLMLSPLVIAMPRPMAEALGWPDTPVGFTEILALTREQQGWGAKGHPEWGPFRLGKTNPNFSTSGLAALVAQAYAATGKTTDLSTEDLDDPEVADFARGVESAVVHYGETTLTFLNNWYRADQRGNPFQYVSAVAVEEKSVIDYNTGNPDGILDAGEEARPPREPLVAIYPKEGTLYADHPLYVPDADWVDDRERRAAQRFVDHVETTAVQETVLEHGFRPGNPEVEVGAPIEPANGVDPAVPETLLDVPSPPVLAALLDDWAEQRKSARVLLLVDVSGSMGDPGDPDTGETKLDLAKAAATQALDLFKDDDEVGLWVFSTELGDGSRTVLEVQAPHRVGDIRESLAQSIADLVPVSNTPLYEATAAAYDAALADFDPTRINAVVLLSDGQNQDSDSADDVQQFEDLLADLGAASEGQASRPVRVFAIAYGQDAQMSTLRQIAEASSAAAYDAADATTIDRVLTEVISNF